MSRRPMIFLCLAVLLCGCGQSTATPTARPTSTPVPPPATSTLTPSPAPTPTATPSPSPTPLPAWEGGFQLGVYARGIPGHAQRMLRSGITWVHSRTRVGSGAQSLIAQAHDSGLRVLLTAVQEGGSLADSGYRARYITFLASLAVQGADGIEVGIEPNIARDAAVLTPAEYADLLCEAYAVIKGVSPDTLVISGAPAPTGYFAGCTSAGCDDLPWIEGLYAAGAGDCMDYIGAHHVAGATSPSARSGHPADLTGGHHSWYFLWQTEEYFEAFEGTRPLCYTSMGYASQEGVAPFDDAFSWARNITNAQQAGWLAEAVELSTSTGMVGCIMIWNLDFGRAGYDPADGYAIIRPGGSCPTCDALQALLAQQ